MRWIPALTALCFVTPAARAWSPAVTEAAGVRLEIPDQDPWTTAEAPRDVAVIRRELETAVVPPANRPETMRTTNDVN